MPWIPWLRVIPSSWHVPGNCASHDRIGCCWNASGDVLASRFLASVCSLLIEHTDSVSLTQLSAHFPSFPHPVSTRRHVNSLRPKLNPPRLQDPSCRHPLQAPHGTADQPIPKGYKDQRDVHAKPLAVGVEELSRFLTALVPLQGCFFCAAIVGPGPRFSSFTNTQPVLSPNPD
jgi:hypothetical protein